MRPMLGRPAMSQSGFDPQPPLLPPLSWPFEDEGVSAPSPAMLSRLLASFCTCKCRAACRSGLHTPLTGMQKSQHCSRGEAQAALAGNQRILSCFCTSTLHPGLSQKPTCSERVRPDSEALWLCMPRRVGSLAAPAAAALRAPSAASAASACRAVACSWELSRLTWRHSGGSASSDCRERSDPVVWSLGVVPVRNLQGLTQQLVVWAVSASGKAPSSRQA